MATNLQRFHDLFSLQNATALAANFYQHHTNSHAVIMTERMQGCVYEPAIARTRIQLQTIQAKQTPPAITGYNVLPMKPRSTCIAKYQRLAPELPQKTVGKQYVWKKGRGAVEKVDRLSGDIFHLCKVTDAEEQHFNAVAA